MKAIVLCGGLGTRLGELTRDMPKPLLHVSGRPFITHVLDHLVEGGVDQVTLAVGFKWQKVREALGDSWRGVPIYYSVEQMPLGTGGAVQRALDEMEWSEALVANGDTLVKIAPFTLSRSAAVNRADIVLSLKPIQDAARYGSVHIDANFRVLGFSEKGVLGPGLINAGLYWIRRDSLNRPVGSAFSLEQDILGKRVTDLRIFGAVTESYFIDIGIPQDLARARLEIQRRDLTNRNP